MTIPSEYDDSQQQQQSTAATGRCSPTAVNPNFSRKYSSTFSTIEWASAASIKGNKPEGDASSGSITRATTQLSSGQFASRSSSSRSSSSLSLSSRSLETFATPPLRGEVTLKHENGDLVILQVPTKGEAAAKPKASASPTSYLKLKEEFLNRSERLQQQAGTADQGKSDIGRKKMVQHDDDSESTGSKHLLQIIQEAEKRVAAERFRFPFSFWNSKPTPDPSKLYAPRKQRKLPALLVSFNSGADDGDEEDGGDGKTSVQKSMKRKCLVRCQAIVLASSIAVGIKTAIVLVLLLGDNLFHDDKRNAIKQFAYSSTHQQDMLELAEQITIACGGDSSMSNCQHLCREHMCCVEQEEEYSCKNDETRDCAVYAGCVVLIDDSFA